ncbi:MAG: CRISPR-associated endonuclease Cas1 [Lachnospiraceae bacterium]|nr:CRISPR-associated endonuclease Cas1 [Lachnospiraceae bacterium]
MAVIYIKEQGAVVQKKGGRIAVSKNAQPLMEFPVSNINGIALMGNVQVTAQALHFLMQQGIDISHYTYGGQYLGQTAAESSKNIFLRLSQYELYNNETRRLEMAAAIVANKISNQLCVISRHRWEEYPEWKKDAEQIRKLQEKISTAETTNELLGIEGMCSNIYFRTFGRMFCGDFEFHGRNRRPPRDPINVIISLGYTFLTKEICSALEAESFERYLGFLHGIRYGRKSLALDIVEEFRQPVIDSMALKMFNKRMLSKYDFENGEDRVILNTDGFRKFCTEYEKWMTGKGSGEDGSGFRRIIRRQVGSLKQCIQKDTLYVPFSLEAEHVRSEL